MITNAGVDMRLLRCTRNDGVERFRISANGTGEVRNDPSQSYGPVRTGKGFFPPDLSASGGGGQASA